MNEVLNEAVNEVLKGIIVFLSIATIGTLLVCLLVSIKKILLDIRMTKRRKNEIDRFHTIFFKSYMIDIDNCNDRYVKGWNDALSEIFRAITSGRYDNG